MVLTLAQAGSGDEPKSFGSFFEQLHATMGEPIPLPARVVDETNQAAQALDRWIRSLAHEPFDAWKVRRLIDAVDASAAKDATRSWDQVAQRYLALKSLRQTLKVLDPTWPDEPLKTELDELSRKFESPRDHNHPQGFDPGSLFRGR